VPLYYGLEKIIQLRLEEREKKSLHSISITSNICRYALDFRIQARNLVVSGSNPIHALSENHLGMHGTRVYSALLFCFQLRITLALGGRLFLHELEQIRTQQYVLTVES